ncbi:MAG: 6,7-dimethyl-8-ribityllumazine synthase [Nitrosopumilus sp. H8]|nr:MAG: 6,7-dimethyl-8-ribityllumazine synthase [Nitrosopumilus sp. H13]RNJ78937.1 MAG: 6,7-dimethyl-8-ribityllumazine synthase [Nitrosopumilus sp. H8]
MRIALLVSEFNWDVTSRMLEVAQERAAQLNLEVSHTCRVPGAFDMPVVADALLRRDDVDAVVTIGTIIRGQTRHDEVISHAVAASLADLSTRHQKPVSLGISGPGTKRHAYARIRPVSERAVEAALKTSERLREIR